MKQINNMKNMKILLFGLIFLLLITSVHAQFFSPPAVLEAANYQISRIRELYSIEGYDVDEKGRQIPVYNRQYHGVRTIIDFFFVLIFVGLALRKNEYLKGLGNAVPAVVAFTVAFVFAFMAQFGLVSMFTPFVINLPFIAAFVLLYFGILFFIGGKEAKTSARVIALILALLITSGGFIFINYTDILEDLKDIAKIPGVKETGYGADIPKARLTKGGEITDVEMYGKTDVEKAALRYTEAQGKLNEAQTLFNDQKYGEAKTKIETAKRKNREAYNFVK